MRSVDIKKDRILIDGREDYLRCGEIHYFRIDPEFWEKELDMLIESGCNAVAFYIPWFVHQLDEETFDFNGRTNPRFNLIRWLELVKSKGLMAFVRPGPYIYAEMTNMGIPNWFLKKYPDARVKSWEGGQYTSKKFKYGVSHNHPDFLRCVERWYKEVCAILREYQQPDGPIFMVQACNELPGMGVRDRNPVTLGIGNEDGMYASFFRNKYESIEALNSAYNTSYSGFKDIRPEVLSEMGELGNNDDLDFYYSYYFPEYITRLIKILRNNGITVPLAHNAFTPTAIPLLQPIKEKNNGFFAGVDNYYTMKGFLDGKSLSYFCEYGCEVLKNMIKCPPVVIELESGYWYDYPIVYGSQLYTWLIWTFASGYKGINMYLFAGGDNLPGMGLIGTTHEWQAPVDKYGKEGQNYKWIKRALSEVVQDRDAFNAPREYDIAIGMYNEPGMFLRDYSNSIVETNFMMFMDNISGEVVDVQNMDAQELGKRKLIWTVSNGYMDDTIQNKLLDYAYGGGKLVVQGKFPNMDLSCRPANAIKNVLNAEAEPVDKDGFWDDRKIVIDGQEIFIGKQIQDVSFEGEVLAFDQETGKPAIIRKQVGKGSITVVPFELVYVVKSQRLIIDRILRVNNITPMVESYMLRCILKADKDGNEYGFVLNYHPIPVCEDILIKGKKYSISLEPYSYEIVRV